MRALLQTLAIFAVIVCASILGACTLLDVKFENGLVNFYQKGGQPMPSGGTFMIIAGPAKQPIGHYEYCQSYLDDCSIVASDTRPTALTRDRWRELVDINNKVNNEIRLVTDLEYYKREEFWTYPDLYGDCEDVVLVKRALLMARGWPASSLLITLVSLKGELGKVDHAVLTVRTDRGDFILDNLEKRVIAWNEAAYRFTKRQSEVHSKKWREVIDPRYPVVAATN